MLNDLFYEYVNNNWKKRGLTRRALSYLFGLISHWILRKWVLRWGSDKYEVSGYIKVHRTLISTR